MTKQNSLFYSLLFYVFFTSCTPSFDVEKERQKIQQATSNVLNTEERIVAFYPESYDTDSIKSALKDWKPVLNDLTKLMQQPSDVTINKVSSSINLQKRPFKIVNVTQTFSILKKDIDISLTAIEDYAKSNLYEYIVTDDTITIIGDFNFIAIYHKNNWEYFNFTIPIIVDAYGLQDSKKLVRLYYDEIFEPATEQWDAESIKDFKDIYSENKDLPQYKNLDFDAYCDCMLQHHEKLDYSMDIPDNYFESETYLNYIYGCRVLSTRE